MKVDYSIECALPYTGDPIAEQSKFELAFCGLVKQFEANGEQYSRVLLVDDMTNNAGEGFDLDAYTDAATNHHADTLVMRESMLAELCDGVYADLATKLTPEDLSRYKGEHSFSSPFYIAVWSLLRLGYLQHPNFPEDQVSAKIVNVLPESFREGEEESLDIVRMTSFPQAADQVVYTYVQEDK